MHRLFVFLALCAPALPQSFPSNVLNGLEWRLIGPFRGGRALAAAGVPGDPTTFYFGAVDGGIWKTVNTGVTWSPVFDDQKIASIGAIAVAPSDPKVIYAGTGEADMRSDIAFGDGVYKSTDAGKTWTHLGLGDSRQIGRILVDPADTNRVYVAALGHAYGPNAERGVYRSTDGGKSWKRILDKGPDIGAGDLAMDPENSRVIYAAMWSARRTPWSKYPPTGNPGSSFYKSTDGGDHWREIRNGLPKGEWGRVGVATGRGAVYVVIDADQGGLFRSSDGGATWTRVGTDPRLTTRAWYFSGVTVDPNNPDTLYLPNVALYRSTDGGKTFQAIKGGPGGDDYHTLWIDPKNSARMILATDQGVTISVDGGKTWSTWYNQPTAQLYHVTTDNQFPYHVYGSQQDSGSIAVSSRTDHFVITARDEFSVGGGESGYIAVDPKNPNIVFAGDTYGTLIRYDRRTSQGQTVTPWLSGSGMDIEKQKFRFPWTPPLVFSITDPATLYYGSQFLLATSDGGLNWRKLSPDLTGADPRAQQDGPVTIANAKARGFGVIYSIAPSPVRDGMIWCGSDTGLIHLTRNDGKTWIDVTPKGLSDWSKITSIEASHFDPAVAYAAVDRHRIEDYKPHLYRTRDYGKTWTEIVDGLEGPAFLNAIREDPARRGLLFVATELGVAVSFDDGDHWQSLQRNLPVSSVRDLVIHGDDLVAATHGRSFWILDDISPLRQISKTMKTELLKPAAAIRQAPLDFQGTPIPPEIPQAKNPPDGAVLDFYLASEPKNEVTLEIFDANNQLVRKFSTADPAIKIPPLAIARYWLEQPRHLSAHAGMNRFVWDLRYPPPVNEVSDDSDSGHPQPGPQVLPGAYRLKLTVNRSSYSQNLKVVLDPRSEATDADLTAQLDLGLKASRAIVRARERARQAKDAKSADAFRQLESQFSAVLAIVESGDRRPPSQAFAIYQEALTRLNR